MAGYSPVSIFAAICEVLATAAAKANPATAAMAVGIGTAASAVAGGIELNDKETNIKKKLDKALDEAWADIAEKYRLYTENANDSLTELKSEIIGKGTSVEEFVRNSESKGLEESVALVIIQILKKHRTSLNRDQEIDWNNTLSMKYAAETMASILIDKVKGVFDVDDHLKILMAIADSEKRIFKKIDEKGDQIIDALRGESQSSRKVPFTNKNLIVPFTRGSSDKALGGTYVQRDDLLEKIDEAFRSQRMVFLSGMGGCGKSELARAYADRHSDGYEEIFWLTCTDGETPDLMKLIQGAELLNRPKKADTAGFTEKVLIIIDNCNKDDGRFLHELDHGTGKAYILVTTRLSCMGSYDSFITVESEDPESFTFEVFRNNYCRKTRWRDSREIQYGEEKSVHEICRAVQYNTMFVSLIAIHLREHSDFSLIECAKKIGRGVSKLKGEVSYSKDLDPHSKEMKEILRFLFSDILKFRFTEAQKEVFTLLSLMPAFWYGTEYIYSLLEGSSGDGSHRDGTEKLLDYGWLQGGNERMAIHPLIAEVISDQPIIVKESSFFERLLGNYLGLPDEDLRKEKSLINRILNAAAGASVEIRIVVMLLLNHPGYKQLFAKSYPEVVAAYFVNVEDDGRRYYIFRDLDKNENWTLLDVQCRFGEKEQAKILKVFNTGIPYKLDFDVSFRGKKIKEIPEGLCFEDPYLKDCIFSGKTEHIGDRAFCGCSSLSGPLNLPEGLTSIGDSAFKSCGGLSGSLVFPDGLKSIGNSAFCGCSGLSGPLVMPDGLTSIGNWAFWGCSGLSGPLILPDSLKSIGNVAFNGCSGLSGPLVLPDGLTYIGDGAFLNCRNLSGSLVLPEGLTSIGDCTFESCSSLNGPLVLPEGLVSIGVRAFHFCERLSGSLILPEGLTSIGDRAFDGCSSLCGPLILQYGLMSIGDSAFWRCSGLSGPLVLPDGLTNIGDSAFWGCSGLCGPLILPDGLTNIGDSAFWDCSGLCGPLVLPDSLVSIGNSAFEGCSGLSGPLVLPEGLTSVGNCAFWGCSGLSMPQQLPKTLKNIDDNTFFGCAGSIRDIQVQENLKSTDDLGSLINEVLEDITHTDDFADIIHEDLGKGLNLPEGLTNIRDFEFFYCNGLSGPLQFPKTLTSIGFSAFSGCSNLSGPLNLPEGLTSLGNSAFSGCSNLSGPLILPDGLTNIGNSAFKGCCGLNGSLVLPERVMNIGTSAFKGCSGLSGPLVLPGGLTSIGDMAFEGCSGLSGSLVLPKGLTGIGNGAFKGCIGLNGPLALPEGLKSIGNKAFSGCSGLSGSLELPEGLMSIGDGALLGCDKIIKIRFLNPNTEIKGDLKPFAPTIISGYKNSTAEKYAKEYNLVFEEIE